MADEPSSKRVKTAKVPRDKARQAANKRSSTGATRALEVPSRTDRGEDFNVEIPPDYKKFPEQAIKDDFDFAQAIQRKTAAEEALPTVSGDLFKRLANDLRQVGLTKMLPLIPREMRTKRIFDIDEAENRAELLFLLETDFKLISVPANMGLCGLHKWTIAEQIRQMKNKTGQAYQPCRKPRSSDGGTTHDVPFDVLEKSFANTDALDHEDRYSNFLDIESSLDHAFRPPVIDEVDILRKIRSGADTGSWSRSAEGYRSAREWMILSSASCVSPFHVDAAGYCTVIVVVEGNKTWYVPKGDWRSCASRFWLNGSRYVDYPCGVSRIHLDSGDCLVQAPGTIHAVVTPKNCLLAGYFFFTAEHFARSIQTIAQCAKQQLYDNDDIKKRDYDDLKTVVDSLDDVTIFTCQQREAVLSEMPHMLEAFGVLEIDKDGGVSIVGKGGASADDAERDSQDGQQSRRAFLSSCLRWWRSAAGVVQSDKTEGSKTRGKTARTEERTKVRTKVRTTTTKIITANDNSKVVA